MNLLFSGSPKGMRPAGRVTMPETVLKMAIVVSLHHCPCVIIDPNALAKQKQQIPASQAVRDVLMHMTCTCLCIRTEHVQVHVMCLSLLVLQVPRARNA